MNIVRRILFLAVVVFGLYQIWVSFDRIEKDNATFLATAIRTTGTVAYTRSNYGGETTYYPEFQYTDAQGRIQVGKSYQSDTKMEFPTGSTISIAYDPAQLSHAEPYAWVKPSTIFLYIRGFLIVFFLVMVGLEIRGYRRQKNVLT